MSILTGPQIELEMRAGRVVIEPPPERAGPNSVDLHLAPTLLVYGCGALVLRGRGDDTVPAFGSQILDAREPNPTTRIGIPEGGIVLQPGVLYLGSTVERTFTPDHVPYVDGRSSIGRLGIFVHCTAGRGDVGFRGNWTLEITCTHPVRIYAGMRIAQLTLHEVSGAKLSYSGRYQNATGVEASKMHQDDDT